MIDSLSNRDRIQAGISSILLVIFLITASTCGWLGWQAEIRQQNKWHEANRLTYLALETKFLAADFNGWQTAYAFDVARGISNATDDESFSRRHFLESAQSFSQELHLIQDHLQTDSEYERWEKAYAHYKNFMDVDQEVIDAYRDGDQQRIQHANELVLGREIDHFSHIIQSTEELIVIILNLSNQTLLEARQESDLAHILMLVCGACILVLINFFVSRANRYIKHQFKLLRRVDRIARTDGLTGIANRRVWDESLAKFMEQSTLQTNPLTVVILDLDHFKKFNDSRGHQAGDRLLRESAQAWNKQLREGDLLARYGGEEFGLLLPKCEPENAYAIVQRLRQSVPEQQTFSAGIALWDGQEEASSFVARADAALYRAKAKGRNRSEIAELFVNESSANELSTSEASTSEPDGSPDQRPTKPVDAAQQTCPEHQCLETV